MTFARKHETIDTVVIGAGQAGLATGYHLARRGQAFVILEANESIGDTWRRRWDSLRLFTPARYDGLPGMRFPAPAHHYPSKDEMADFLEAYANRFALPVRTGVRVERVAPANGGLRVETTGGAIEARQVVVAMANFQRPRVPSFADELDPEIRQLHAREYRNPGQLREGGVLVVGAGNSGAEIAIDVAPRHRAWLSGRPTGEIPFDIDTRAARRVLIPLVVRALFHHVLTVDTPIGRKARPGFVGRGGPLVRTSDRDLKRAGVQRVPRTTGVQGGKPVLADGRVLDVANVVWCTGYRAGFEWIDAPLPDEHLLTHRHGPDTGVPGLYFVGLHFLYAASSAMVQGAGRDADRVARAVARRPGRGPGSGAVEVERRADDAHAVTREQGGHHVRRTHSLHGACLVEEGRHGAGG